MSCIVQQNFAFSRYNTDAQICNNYKESSEFQGFQNNNSLKNQHDHQECEEYFEQYGISQQKPKHPQYAIKTVRHSSYRNFPAGQNQTPEELAEAGLFYSGKEDLVYCFFCGQGLKSWEPEDEPWIEHAKWSPKCRFVHDVHGSEFIKSVQNAKTNSKEMDQLRQNLHSNKNKSDDSAFKTKGSSRSHYKPSVYLLETIAALSLISQGFSRETVWKLINIFVRLNNTETFKGEDLMKTAFALEDGKIEDYEDEDKLEISEVEQEKLEDDIVLEAEDVSNSTDTNKINSNENSEQGENASEDREDEVKALLTENEQLKNRTLCKVCLEDKVSIVFLPCGHLACCSQCAPAIRSCPICRTFIKGTVKTFLT